MEAGEDVRILEDDDGDGWVMVNAGRQYGYVELSAFAGPPPPSKR